VKHSANHTDLLRQIHANARELDLPGSPPGANGHAVISKAAKDIYGVNSLSELPYEKLLELNEALLRTKGIPEAGATNSNAE
jgi:hypothetical protein